MNTIDWGATLRDDAAWAVLEHRPDLAESAMLYLTNTIADVDQKLTYAKADAAVRMSPDEFADHRDWRARAIGFKRILERRKRELTPVVKRQRQQTRDHDADAQWKWDHSVSHEMTVEEAFKTGFKLGRTT